MVGTVRRDEPGRRNEIGVEESQLSWTRVLDTVGNGVLLYTYTWIRLFFFYNFFRESIYYEM